MSEPAIRFGEADLTTCDREPIHIPGSIQPHGVLLVIDRERLAVEQAAGDTQALLGIAIEAVVGLSVGGIFDADTEIFVRSKLSTPTSVVAPIIRLGIGSRQGLPTLDLTLHALGATAIIEVERASRTATFAGEAIAQLKTLMAAVQATTSVDECCWTATRAMRSATGFDRAMVYRFLPDGSAGEALRVLLLETVLKNAELLRRERALEATKVMAEELERRVALRTDQLRALVADLEATEDRQRRQIARDLHDDLGQTLAAARIRLTLLGEDDRSDIRARASEIGALIDRASGAIRSLASQLAPDVLHELGLIPALEWLCEDMERTFGLRVRMFDDGDPKPLAQETRSILFRAVRELLINVSRHAQTDSALVECECQDERVIIRVADSGIGGISTDLSRTAVI